MAIVKVKESQSQKSKKVTKVNLSNIIAQMISDMLEDVDSAEIQRNELAEKIGCVPSQINYVISSRFTPEHGYIVESRRGGGGYIRITKANYTASNLIMQLINAIGPSLDEKTCRAHILNLNGRDFLSNEQARLMLSATNEKAYASVPQELRDKVRAAVFKNMLLTTIK
jgi:transcriptional regulator CtsR